MNDNITALRVLGGSASLQLNLPAGFHATGTINVSRAEKDDGSLYERLPTWFGNFQAGWRGEAGRSITLIGVWAGDRTVMESAEPTEAHVGPRLDLRLTAVGPVGFVRGLSWGASLGFDLNPLLPYQIAAGTDTPSGVSLYPDQPRLYGFLGIRYAHDDD